MSLDRLILEAQALAGIEHPCSLFGHAWETDGGRQCPRGGQYSQVVYKCARCGDHDYGEPGAPGWTDCENGECDCTFEEEP